MATNFISKIEERMFLKKYTNVQNLKNADTARQVRWFRLIDSDVTRKNALMANCIDQSAMHVLWDEYYRILAPYINKVDSKQFKLLLFDRHDSALKDYMLKHTLSDELIETFINHLSYLNVEGDDKVEAVPLLNILADYILKQGLNPEPLSIFINYIADVEKKSNNKEKVQWLLNVLSMYIRRHDLQPGFIGCIGSYSEAIANTIRKAIRVNNYVDAVTSTGIYITEGITIVFATRVDELVAEKLEMPAEAQALMTFQQYEYYHSAGLKLAKKAIVAMISRGVAGPFAQTIFRNEDVYPMWPELHDTLMMFPYALTDYQRVRKEKRQKEGIG